ncbi:unnamed protein product [Amoebophrya sp. A25]|nr:unnamed protein product [Amoebophrya sp. A25]|eukprot:GSA25T00007539001.1
MSGPDLPLFVKRKLETLQCPDANPCLSNFPRTLLWLEEEKIRLWTPAERSKLREVNAGGKWYRAAREYLKELGIDEQLAEKLQDRDVATKVRVLDLLTSMAVHDEYQDAAAEGTVVRMDPQMEAENDEEVIDDVVGRKERGLALDQLVEPLNLLFSQNGLPTLSADVTEDDIAAAVGIVHARLFPPAVGKPDTVDLQKVPTGVEGLNTASSSRGLQEAVAILRFLHNQNMRNFQAQINDTINSLQQFTADPKTDGAIGRVGR